MRKQIIFLIMIFVIFPTNAFCDNYKILRVVDGDTVIIDAPYLPKPLKPELSLRILGIDTPEKDFRAKCKVENDLGHQATDFTVNKIASAKSINVEIVQWDKFGSRLDGNIIVDGESLATLLINNNLARPYNGEKKKSWCE